MKMIFFLLLFNCSQGVLINVLVYYDIIKDVFNSDIDTGDIKLLSSRLQNFLICIEMFIAALAHQYSFPYKPFQINEQSDINWFRTFLLMMDMEDVRQDVFEHFDVVGTRISRGFRTTQPSYSSQQTESDYLITPNQPATRVLTVSRVKEPVSRNYGTYSSSASDKRQKSTPIGKDTKKYRIVNIEESSKSSDGQGPSPKANTSTSNMTQSTTSTTSSSFGINVRGLENDPINYRNPDV